MSGSAQGGLIPKGVINNDKIIKPTKYQAQVHRDEAPNGLGKYYGKLEDGTEEPIGGPGFPAVGIPFANDTDPAANDILVSIPGATPTDGYSFEVNILTTNIGATFLTITQNGLGPKSVVDSDGNPLVGGELVNESIYLFAYDLQNDRYQLLGLAKPSSNCSGILLNTVYVSKNGNDGTADGSICKPFLTIQPAINLAYTLQDDATRTRPVVLVNPGTYTGDLVLKANVFVAGYGFNSSRIIGNVTIDATFTPAGDWRSGFQEIGIFGTLTADWLALASNEGKLYLTDVRVTGAVLFTSFSTINQVLWFGGEYFGTIKSNGVNTNLIGVQSQNNPGLIVNGTAVGANLLSTEGNLDNVTINGNGFAYEANLGHSIQKNSTLTINGTPTVNVYANSTSIPVAPKLIIVGTPVLTPLNP